MIFIKIEFALLNCLRILICPLQPYERFFPLVVADHFGQGQENFPTFFCEDLQEIAFIL